MARCGGDLFLTSFNRGRGAGPPGPPGSATNCNYNRATMVYSGTISWAKRWNLNMNAVFGL